MSRLEALLAKLPNPVNYSRAVPLVKNRVGKSGQDLHLFDCRTKRLEEFLLGRKFHNPIRFRRENKRRHTDCPGISQETAGGVLQIEQNIDRYLTEDEL